MLRLQVEREALFDPPFELIAHITVCLQSGRAVALDKGRIEGIPELDVAGHGSVQFDRRVLGLRRSAERRGGKECVRTCRYRWMPYHNKQNTIKRQPTTL